MFRKAKEKFYGLTATNIKASSMRVLRMVKVTAAVMVVMMSSGRRSVHTVLPAVAGNGWGCDARW